MTDTEILQGLTKVKEVYGLAHAQRLEQLFRIETSHFKSGNFLICLSPGGLPGHPEAPGGPGRASPGPGGFQGFNQS
jgi:hypothetical protein